jgi:hypothetical protein
MDGGAEPIAAPAERHQIERQARVVRWTSLAFAAALTALSMWI